MIYPATFEQKIGFDRLREQVAARCTMRAARERLAAEGFSTSAREIERRLALADEMRLLLDMEHDFPGGEYPDVDYIVAKLRVEGSFLDVEEVVTLRRALAAIGGIVSFIISREERYPALHARTRGVAAFPEIVQRIDGILDRFGQVKDNASPALQEIRRSIREREGQAAKRLQAVLSAAKGAGIVDADAQISIRDGKAVIPVSAGNKRKLNGFIHDESATGKTFYVEPVEVVEINNELRELEYAERREVVRILTEFTEAIRPDAGLIADSGDYLAEIDMLRAKGRWASENRCVRPILSTDDRLVLKNARHPLLQQTLRAAGREIVPLDLQLDRRKRILVISGPNAGGKSVCLKTTGIVQYMAQCGLLPPVYENSHFGIFESIFIDIGDDQSIEDDLSTYSSHLRSMKHFLTHGSGTTLALIDEFGGGTEPQIGGAIAQAVLKQFNELKMWGVITTHYHNLKQLAEETPGLVNGSMLYDRQRMQPLFRLAIGQPGSSFAIEIARKTGLPEQIIEDAKAIVGSDYVNMDKYLLDIARDRRYWENKRQDIRQKEKRIEELLARYEEEMETLRGKRREIISEARDEARRILDGSNATIERTIREIRSSQADKERTKEARRQLESDREALRNETDAEHPLLDRRIPKPKKKKEPKPKQPAAEERPIEEGDNVLLDGAGTVGTVMEITGKNAVVAFGQMKTTVKLSRLKRTMRKAGTAQASPSAPSYLSAQTADTSRERQLSFSNEIDVRGMRTDEAVQAVMYYIDDAVQFNVGRVRILHGTGTGALRQYIRRYLDTVKAVRQYHDEDVRFGGPGITVVEF